MREELFDLVQSAAIAGHDKRLAIVIKLCQYLRNNELDIDEVRRLLLSYELSSEELGVITQLLSDDMVISKQFRYSSKNNCDVYSLIILAIIEYRHIDAKSHQYLKQAFEKLIIISPPQIEIVAFLSNILSSSYRSCRTVEEQNENSAMQQAIENFLEKT